MIQFLSKSEQRKLKFLQLLYINQDYVDLKSIVEHLNCLERTVQEDIRELSDSEISHIFEIESRAFGYKIRLRNNVSVDAFGHFIMSRNDCFNLLEFVFFNNDYSVEDLAEKIHVSLPTIYRMINRINKRLGHHFDLKFQTNPCRIVGDEVEVRSFYMQYFIERYPISEWPFKDINEEKLLALFKQITETVVFKLQFSDIRTLELSLAVAYIRLKQGYPMTERSQRITHIINSLRGSDRFLSTFLDVFETEVDPELFNDNLVYLIKDHFFFNYEGLLKSASVDEYSARSFIHLSGMINDLSKKYNIPVSNKEELLYNIHNSAQFGIRNINVRPILINNKQILLKQIKDFFPLFYNDIKLKMSDYIDVMELDNKDALLYHLMHNFVTRWTNLINNLYLTQRKIKIRVISSHDIYHAKLMRSLLQTEFYNQVDVTLIETIDLNELLSNHSEIDIFITNFTLPVMDRNIIAVNDIPTTEDFKVIKEVIREIRLLDH